MPRIRRRLALIGLLAATTAVAAPPEPETAPDPRTLVPMPAPAQALLRQDMLAHMAALNQVLAALANGDLKGAGEIAESGIGKSSMGKHRGSRYAPGRHMLPAMHQIGFDMHEAASEFAELAAKGDAKQANAALARVTGACVACHYAYRLR